jgi:hypothetical protein
MIRSILAAALIALLPLAPAAAQDITGMYYGTVGTGAGDVPVRTEFAGKGEILAGHYRVEDPSGTFDGTLTDVKVSPEGVATMIWTDRDGSGTVSMAFTPDGQSFTGKWKSADGGGGFWNGTKAP